MLLLFLEHCDKLSLTLTDPYNRGLYEHTISRTSFAGNGLV